MQHRQWNRESVHACMKHGLLMSVFVCQWKIDWQFLLEGGRDSCNKGGPSSAVQLLPGQLDSALRLEDLRCLDRMPEGLCIGLCSG
jgi:hypothetical protein